MTEEKWRCDSCGKLYSYKPDFGLCHVPGCNGRISPIMRLVGFIDNEETCGLYQCRLCKTVELSSGRAPTCGKNHEC